MEIAPERWQPAPPGWDRKSVSKHPTEESLPPSTKPRDLEAPKVQTWTLLTSDEARRLEDQSP